MQEVRLQLKGLDPLRRVLPQTWSTRGGQEAVAAKSAKFGEAKTCALLVFIWVVFFGNLLIYEFVDLKTISKFAQLEYKFGDAERGKTIFEGIVDSHPKRWDLWSIYIDMQASQGDIANIRNLFDRILALKMTSHKAK